MKKILAMILVVAMMAGLMLLTGCNKDSETTETTEETEQKYNPTFDIEDNVFLDALAYTGYNIEKHRADGLMWEYVLSAD